MKKLLSKAGLCTAIVIGSISHQALAVEAVFPGITVKPLTGASTALYPIGFPNLAKGQHYQLHALIVTNNDTSPVTITIFRTARAVTGGINVPAGGTRQIMFTDGFQIRKSDIMDVQIGSTAYPASSHSNVDLTFDMK